MISNQKIKTIIVDDEYPARVMIKSLSENYADMIEITGEAKNGKNAVKLINETNADLIFLDINMPDLSGFELLQKIKHESYIIFTTAYQQYAINAFETNAIDYLVKPIEETRFAKSIEKLQRFIASKRHSDLSQLKNIFQELQQIKKPSAIPIKTGDKFILVRLDNISFFEAKEKYVFIITTDNKKHLSDTRLSEFEEMLPSNFIRVQKSFIINKDKIYEIHKYFGNRLIITMDDKNKTRITSGITYINSIRLALGL